MIEAMKKYSFLVFHADYENFLKKLRDLGVLHIESGEKELTEDAIAGISLIKRVNNVITEMKALKYDGQSEAVITNGNKLMSVIDEKHDAITKVTQEIVTLKKERDAILPWGNFNAEIIKGIEDAGYNIRFLVCEEKNWDEEWRTRADIELVNNIQGEMFLMAVSGKEAELLEHPNLNEVKLNHPLSWYDEKLVALEKEQEAVKTSLGEISSYAPGVLKAYVKELEAELDFSNAIESGDKHAEDKVVILTGWVPVVKEADFCREIDKEQIAYVSDKAKPEDNMPVKLKNSKFAKLFEAIGELYTLPNHQELDLTPFFAPFYMLFFGFCLGDAGYGLLIILGTLYGMTKVKPKFKPLLQLGFYLGLATTIMGIVGGTFFGIMFGVEEDGRLMQSVEWLREYQQYVLNTDNLMYMALGLGYVQVIFGMILKAVNLGKVLGAKHAISQLGWIIIVAITLPAFALGNWSMIPEQTANTIAVVSGIAGAVPALFYNSPGKNIFLNFGTGLWETYGMASGLLGDVLSYIRLFALGLSSAILGSVFNSLAMDLSPDTIILRQLVIVLILAFGHSLNLFMALLGSFVHPLRLTFVEFYKNAGFEGGGNKYEPFSVK